jgi:hypothetical protein
MNTVQREGLQEIAWGAVWIAGAIAFWLAVAGNPIDDLRLTVSARSASGQITDSREDAEARDEGGTAWHHAVAYTFTLPNGREVTSGSSGAGRLPSDLVNLKGSVPAEIEYLPSSPSVNRLKGSGSQSVTEWFLRKVGVGGLLLVVFAWPGVKMIRDGMSTLRSG